MGTPQIPSPETNEILKNLYDNYKEIKGLFIGFGVAILTGLISVIKAVGSKPIDPKLVITMQATVIFMGAVGLTLAVILTIHCFRLRRIATERFEVLGAKPAQPSLQTSPLQPPPLLALFFLVGMSFVAILLASVASWNILSHLPRLPATDGPVHISQQNR
jgi:hypothetical protein